MSATDGPAGQRPPRSGQAGRRQTPRELASAALPPRGREAFAFLGLGSNVGDRLSALQSAVDLVHARPGVRVDAVSSVYETEPVGGPAQDPYLNLAVRIATRRSPKRLLAGCQAVEQALGRVRTVRWGPRTIDIDVLLYEQRVVATRRLEIPHPRLTERAFVLIPLIEVAPGATLPDGRSLATALAALAPVEGIHLVGSQVVTPDPRAAGPADQDTSADSDASTDPDGSA